MLFCRGGYISLAKALINQLSPDVCHLRRIIQTTHGRDTDYEDLDAWNVSWGGLKSQQDMWSTERNDPGQMVHNISPSPGFPLEIAGVPFPLLNKPPFGRFGDGSVGS